jgi:penicillin-insensitive murein endopeptidase
MVNNMLVICLLLLFPSAMVAQQELGDSLSKVVAEASLGKDHRAALAQYCSDHLDDDLPSKAIGTVSKGSLVHGKLIPFQGDNFCYYDTISYLDDRAFVHHKVREVVLAAYQDMATRFPGRLFTIMECSKRDGGKIWPHRTHQNGLSIDFMVPMSAQGLPFYGLDTLGFAHYLLDYDGDGTVEQYPDAHIDFEVLAAHLLALQLQARQQGLQITKVLLRKELLDNLYASALGPQLKASKLYFPTALEPLINVLHDNHYHVDFGLL